MTPVDMTPVNITPASRVPDHVNPLQWSQALGLARQSCARFFRDGSSAVDAMRAFGVTSATASADWSKAVEAIALALCSAPKRKAA